MRNSRFIILFPLLFGSAIGVSIAFKDGLYLLAAIFAILFFFQSLYRPFFVLLVMIFFLPFTRIGVVDIGRFSAQPSQILTLIIAACLVIRLSTKRNGANSLVATPLDVPLLFFLLINVFSVYQSYFIPVDYAKFTVWGRNLAFLKSITQIVWMMVGILSYYVTVNLLKDQEHLEKAIKVWLFSAGLASAFGIYQFIGSYFNFPYAIESNILPARFPEHITGVKNIMRGTSVFTEPAHFSIYLLTIFPLCFALIASKKYILRPVYLKLLFVLIGFGIIVTFSRTSLICGLIVIVSACLLYGRKGRFSAKLGWRKKLVLAGIGIFLGLLLLNAILAFFSFPILTGVFKNMFTSVFDTRNFSNFQRLASWGAALKMFSKHPFLGVGAGNYFINYFYNIPEWATKANMPLWVKGNSMPQVVNNIFLETLAEIGIFGILSFLFILFFLLRGPFIIQRKIEGYYWYTLLYGVILGFIGMLSGFLFFSAFYFPFVWAYMGLITSIEKVARKEYISGANENRN